MRLEAGLESLSPHTAGFYVKTHNLPALAMDRLAGALAGHYVVAFARPEGTAPGAHGLRLDLAGREGAVLGRPYVCD